VIPIIGARRIAQLADNLASLTVELSPEQRKTLDEASAIDLGFPYELFAQEVPRTFRYGGMRDRILV
jgi:diketogulonate reductase-like aldo/keto reductase